MYEIYKIPLVVHAYLGASTLVLQSDAAPKHDNQLGNPARTYTRRRAIRGSTRLSGRANRSLGV